MSSPQVIVQGAAPQDSNASMLMQVTSKESTYVDLVNKYANIKTLVNLPLYILQTGSLSSSAIALSGYWGQVANIGGIVLTAVTIVLTGVNQYVNPAATVTELTNVREKLTGFKLAMIDAMARQDTASCDSLRQQIASYIPTLPY